MAAQETPAAPAAVKPPPRKPAGPEMVTVRLSHRPDADVRVPRADLPNLRQQGLLAQDPEAGTTSAKEAVK